MKASATSADGGTSRETKEEGEGDEGETRKGWSTWLGGVFLVPGFRLLGREARGSFCSPRRRIRRPTLSPPTRSSPLPPPPSSSSFSTTATPPASSTLAPYPTPVLPLFKLRSILPQPPLRHGFLPQRSSAPPTPPTSAGAMVDHV